jgi:hypothetical protein
VLNRFTLPQLWRKIPVLGVLPFVGTRKQISNEDRAMLSYERAKLEDMKSLLSIGARPGDPAVKREDREIEQAEKGIGADLGR